MRIRVTGRVQGVGFRYWVMRQAHTLSLSGSVMNLPDGSVEVMVCGTAEKVEQMIIFCGTGPVHAHVENLRVLGRQKADVCPEGFRILH